MRKDSLLLVVGHDVVVRSSRDMLVDGRVVRSTDQRHRPQRISLVDSCGVSASSTEMGSAKRTHRGNNRTGAALIHHLIDLDG